MYVHKVDKWMDEQQKYFTFVFYHEVIKCKYLHASC